MKIENVVCPFCGCLCDDIVVEVEDSRITAVKNACASGRSLFLNAHTQAVQPKVNGEEVDWPQAIDAAARILNDAASPLIYGLSSTASEAQRKAIALADLLGATIDSTSSVCHGPTTIGIQNDKIMAKIEDYLLDKIPDPMDAMQQALAEVQAEVAKQKVK